MALYRDTDMVRAIAGPCRAKFSSDFAGRQGENTLAHDRVFSLAAAEGRIADIIRTRVVPVIFPKSVALEPVRDYPFCTVSQIILNYRGTPLSIGCAGHVPGGDRLPWVSSDDADNFASLSAMFCNLWPTHIRS